MTSVVSVVDVEDSCYFKAKHLLLLIYSANDVKAFGLSCTSNNIFQ